MKRKIFLFKNGKTKAKKTFQSVCVSDYLYESDWTNEQLLKLLGEVCSFEKVGRYFDFIESVEFDEFVAKNSKKQFVTVRVYFYEDTECDES